MNGIESRRAPCEAVPVGASRSLAKSGARCRWRSAALVLASIVFVSPICLASSRFLAPAHYTYAGYGDPFVRSGGFALGDFDEDGVVDAVSLSLVGDGVAVLLGRGDGTFSLEHGFGVGRPRCFAVADFDRDGHEDVAALDDRSCRVYFGSGPSLDWQEVAIDLPLAAQQMAAADFDGDGQPDLALASWSNELRVLMSRPSRAFSQIASPEDSIDGTPIDLLSADLNRDGLADLVLRSSPIQALLLTSRGDGTFHRRTMESQLLGNDLVVTDATGDGIPDLVTAGWFSVAVLPGLGDGTLGQPTTTSSYFWLHEEPQGVAVGDVTGDGIDDVLVTLQSRVATFAGLGGGVYEARSDVWGTPTLGEPLLTDLNGDERLDLISTELENSGISSMLGDGAGRFGERTSPACWAGPNALPVAIADVDEDGRRDLIALNFSNDGLQYWTGVALSRGVRGFEYVGSPAFPPHLNRMQVEDFDQDGHLDLIGWGQGSFGYLPGDGAGSFGEHRTLPSALDSRVADVNGDSRPDIVSASGNSIRVRLNLGYGEVSSEILTALPPGVRFHHFLVGDLNGDSRSDLAAAAYSTGEPVAWTTSLLAYSTGDGHFELQERIWTGQPNEPAIFDANEDGRLDFGVLERMQTAVGYSSVEDLWHIRIQDSNGNLGPEVLEEWPARSTPGGSRMSLGPGEVPTWFLHRSAFGVRRGDESGRTIEWDEYSGLDPYPPDPVFGDLDGDGRSEFTIRRLEGGPQGDSLRIFWGRDPEPPTGIVYEPPGGLVMAAGHVKTLRWKAQDNRGLTTTDLFLSRHGRRGPYERIALELQDATSYDWNVTGPLSDSVAIKLVMHDVDRNVGLAITSEMGRIVETLDASDEGSRPRALAIRGVTPNPARESVSFDLDVPAESAVTLDLMDLQGRRVARLWSAEREPAETRRLTFTRSQLRGASAGIYFVRAQAGGATAVRRVALLD